MGAKSNFLSQISGFFAGLATVLTSRSTRDQVTWAIALFFIIKLIFISAGLVSHKNTRLGDDGLAYLWFAKSNFTNELFDSKGVRSLEKQALELKRPGETVDEAVLRRSGAFRVSGHTPSNILMVFSGLERLNLSFYQMFWVHEFFILIIVTLALWVFFRHENRPRGLLLLIPLLAFGRLPGQGLHFFVPSVAALAFGMMAWGWVGAKKPKLVALFFTTLAALMSHLIGFVYGGMAGILVIFRWLTRQISFKRATIEAVVLFAALAVFVMFRFADLLEPYFGPVAHGFAVEDFGRNVKGLLLLLIKFARHDVVVTALVLLGGSFVVLRLPLTNFYKQITLILFVLVLVTFFYSAVGFPGEVGLRLTVPLFVIFYCFSGNFFRGVIYHRLKKSGRKAYKKIMLVGGIGILAASLFTFGAFVIYTTKNLATRWAQFDRAGIAMQWQSLPQDAHILYTDTELALEAAFLSGGYKFKSSAWPYLETKPAMARQWYAQNPADYVVLMTLRSLQPESRFKSLPLKTRPYGFRLNKNRRLKINIARSAFSAVTDIKIKLTESPETLKVAASENCQVTLKPVSTGNWYGVQNSTCLTQMDTDILTLNITGKGFVAGIAVQEIKDNVSWPWGKDITGQFRQKKWISLGKKSVDFSFAWDRVFAKAEARNLIGLLNRDLEVISDHSGLLLLKVKP